MNFKTSLKMTVAAAALVAVAAPAHAGSVVSGSDAVSLKLSGQFNKAAMWADNGGAQGVAIGDNDTSRSRIWITPTATVNEALTVTGRIEYRMSSNRLSQTGIVDINGTSTASDDEASDNAGGTAITETWMAFNHKQFGGLQLGLGSSAVDGAGEAAFNPASSIIDTGDLTDGNDIQIQLENVADNVFTDLAVDTFISAFQGGDIDGVTYSTPTFAGFQGKASYASNGNTGLGLYYGGKFASFEVTGSAAYENSSASSTTVEGFYTTSLGVKHASGLSLSGGYAEESNKVSGTAEGSTWFVLGGYEASLTSMGKTGFAVQYLKSEDITNKGDEGTVIAVGVEQGVASGVSVYAGTQFISVDRTGSNFEDVTTVMVGGKLSF